MCVYYLDAEFQWTK